jgi:outer membrane lipoprotein LolB
MRLDVPGIIITCLLFSACSLKPVQPNFDSNQQEAVWLKHKTELKNINQWQISGRFGAQSETESWNGSINWSQNLDQYSINISGPLSSGSFSLQGNSDYSILKISKEKTYGAEDPELLLETHTGLRLPIKNLRYWLIGSPSPLSNKNRIMLNNEGLLSQLSQVGWDISFKNYIRVNDTTLPKKIFLENHEFDVRLVIQHWEVSG